MKRQILWSHELTFSLYLGRIYRSLVDLASISPTWLLANFLYKSASLSFFLVMFWLCNERNAGLALSYKKALIKCWWNWPLASISPTCLRKAVTPADSESVKWLMTRLSFFALLGSAGVKTSSKMLWNWLLICFACDYFRSIFTLIFRCSS